MNNRVRALREVRGCTQEELARQLGVTRQTIIAIESGRYNPTLPLAFQIAHLFGQPIEAIFLFQTEDEET